MARATVIIGGVIGGLCIGFVAAAGSAALAPARAQSLAPGSTALGLETRMSQIEDQMRDLTGRIEELTNTVHQLQAQLDREQSDTDLRFKQLEGGANSSAIPNTGASAASPAARSASGTAATSPSSPLSGNLAAEGKQSSPPAEAHASPPTPAPVPGKAASAGNDPLEQYNYAMGLLTEANYPAAEQAMRSFVQRFPKDRLAGNAQYWLGETFYVRKLYRNAATAFAQGYERYPKSPKAPDDLLKLGMSLAALNEKADACKAYARLDREFPDAARAVKDRLAVEKRRAGC